MDPVSLLQITIHGVMMGGVYICIALGLDVIVGVLGIINMAHGQFIVYGMYISYFLFTLYGLSLPLVFAVLLLIFLLISIPLYTGIFRLIMGKPLATQLFFTASLAVVMSNAAIVAWKSDPRQITDPIRYEPLLLGALSLNKLLTMAFFASIIATILVFLFLYKTERGTIIRGIIMNRELISLIGIAPERVYIQGFLIGMLLTGVGAYFLSIYYPVTPAVGTIFNLYVWASILLGGVGTIRGVFIGGLIIGLTQALAAYFLPSAFQHLVVLVVFIVVIAFRPTGILKGRL